MARSVRLLVLPLTLTFAVSGLAAAGYGVTRSPDGGGLQAKTGATPPLAIPFIENRGQVDQAVRYYLHGSSGVGFMAGGLRMLAGGEPIDLSFEGARSVSPQARGPAETVFSDFRGDRDEWRTGVPTYDRILYREPWPGIDIHYTRGASALKYEFRVAPGADPSRIRLSYPERSSLRVASDGTLLASTSGGLVRDAAPYVYQQIGARRVPVEGSYAVDGTSYGFRLGSYDRSRPLVIDPAIVYSGFIGGSGQDSGEGVAVDPGGNAYVTGQTSSADFGTTTFGPASTPDAFVAKVRADGTSLAFAAILGGSMSDGAEGVDVGADGSVVIAGQTTSPDFPTAVGPDTTYNEPGPDMADNGDAFAAKLDPSGTSLVYSGYLGGSDDDDWAGMAVDLDPAGNAFVVGSTESADFPVPGGYDTTHNGPGSRDAFVVEITPAGQQVYGSFFGGSDTDWGQGVAVHPTMGIYLAGQTTSSTAEGFPATGGDTTVEGADGYVAHLSPDGSTLLYARYVGGSSTEDLYGIDVDGDGNAYVTGYTQSSDFPATSLDTVLGGGQDAFLAKVAPSAALVYATFLGGSASDGAGSVAVDGPGSAYVAGATSSSDFPVLDAADPTYGDGGADAFVTKVNPAGTALAYSTFVGGADLDTHGEPEGITVDAGGAVYLVGTTRSTDFPAVVGPDTSHNGPAAGFDAFVTKLATTERCKGKAVTHLGSEGDDEIETGPGDDVVLALGGDDTIKTQGGQDTICAGGGNDTIRAGSGRNDLSLGEGGNDKILGQGGPDRANGGPGKDLVKGGSGKDRLNGGSGKDKVKGQGGSDRLNGGGGNDFCHQGGGSGPARKCERGPAG